MIQQRPSKWTAFLLSMLVPGSGQLLAGSATALVWFVAATFVTLAISFNVDSHSEWIYWLQTPLWMGLCLASAWHARGLLETQPPWPSKGRASRKVKCHVRRDGKVHASICIETCLSARELWQRVCQLEEFLTIDPFHERVTLMRDVPAEGVDVVLHHDAFGRKFDRFGRILRWKEGTEFTISDLSAKHPRRSFPHTFNYRVEPNGEKSTLLVKVNGRWTNRLVPLWLRRLWIAFVCRYHAMLLSHAL